MIETLPADAPAGLDLKAAAPHIRILALTVENHRLRCTVSFQLGAVILGLRSLAGWLRLPGDMTGLVAAARRCRSATKPGASQRLEERLRVLLRAVDQTSAAQIEAAVADATPSSTALGELLAGLSTLIVPVDAAKGLALMRRAVALDSIPRHQAALANLLYDAGAMAEPLALYQTIQASGAALSSRSAQRLALLAGMARARDAAPRWPSPAVRLARSGSRSILYVAASAFPHHTNGYTARTHGLLKALIAQGETVRAVTRAGYPADRKDARHGSPGRAQKVDGVSYSHLAGPAAHATPFDVYRQAGASALLEAIAELRPSIVHAASNHVNAAPALMAAREAGLPFVYEVRGLWELTQAARDPGFEHSERFAWQRDQEAFVAREADRVVTLSHGLKGELIRRGVSAERILIAPNCVDGDAFLPPAQTNVALREALGLGEATVLGFLGSMPAYEGLADLVVAVARLRSEGHDVCALLVGDGVDAPRIREVAKRLGVLPHVVMPGRVAHKDVGRWYAAMDVAVYPRRRSRVTELVPQLKPLEAMAMGIPVVASDVAAIRETLTDDETGFLFESANPVALAERLTQVLMNRDHARAVAEQGRRHVLENYSWRGAADALRAAYDRLA